MKKLNLLAATLGILGTCCAESGTVKEGHAPDISQYSCDGMACPDGKTCYDGRCLEKARDGESCSADNFMDRCDGNTLVFCSGYHVTELACKDGKHQDSCRTFASPHYLSGFYSDCIDVEKARCSTPGSIKTECYESAVQPGKYFTSTYECGMSTTGTHYYYLIRDEACASDSCNADRTACGEIEACAQDSYAASCNGDILRYCTSGRTVGNLDCKTALNAACATFKDESGIAKAGCFTSKHACEKAQMVRQSCSERNGRSIVTVQKCMRSENGKLFWVTQDTEECADSQACNATLTACAAKTPCREATYQETCADQIGSYCYEGTVARFNCDSYSALYGTEHTCHVFKRNGNDYAQCVSNQDLCTLPGKTKTSCTNTASAGAMLTTKTCLKTQDDDKSYLIASDIPVACANTETCNDAFTGCEETQPCNSAVSNKCRGNVLAYCDTKSRMILKTNCKALGTAYECVGQSETAGCYEPCQTRGDVRDVCLDPTGTGIIFGHTSYRCDRIGDALYWIGSDTIETCANGCNADATDCLK